LAEVIEAEVVEPGTDLEPVASPSNLFRTDDPAMVLKRAQETADALMPVVRDKGLIAKIQGRDHLQVEAWQTLGAMLGVTAVCEWTRRLEDGWEARVIAQTLDGRTIGAAEAECLRAESTWKNRDDYALRSMAQTRATSKALASVLRFVATLAGASGTPAEEMPREDSAGVRASDKQVDFMRRLLTEQGVKNVADILAYAKENLEGGRGGRFSIAIDSLKDNATRDAAINALQTRTSAWQATQSDVPADETGL
jgi:hypothetical protein